MKPVAVDLAELQEIMDDLSDAPPEGEKRKNALTKDDVLIIAKIVQAVSHKSCAMGLTADEIGTLKTAIKTMNKGILVVGYAILGAVGAGIVSLIAWAVKHGILEVASVAGKAGK